MRRARLRPSAPRPPSRRSGSILGQLATFDWSGDLDGTARLERWRGPRRGALKPDGSAIGGDFSVQRHGIRYGSWDRPEGGGAGGQLGPPTRRRLARRCGARGRVVRLPFGKAHDPHGGRVKRERKGRDRRGRGFGVLATSERSSCGATHPGLQDAAYAFRKSGRTVHPHIRLLRDHGRRFVGWRADVSDG